MNRNKENDEDNWEYDRERIIGAILIAIIIIGAAYLVVDMYTPTGSRNVSYSLNESKDTDRINLVFRTFFGTNINVENASLVTVVLRIADIPDVSQVRILINTEMPTHLAAIVVAGYSDETNVLHGQNQVPDEQTSYLVTLNIGQYDLIVYLFLEATQRGSWELIVNST